MFHQILASFLQSHEVLLGVSRMQWLPRNHVRTATMHLKGTSSSNNDNSVGSQATNTALDVAELLHAHIGSESGFSDHIAFTIRRITLLRSSQFQGYSISKNRRVSVRNVGEWTGMHEDRCSLQDIELK